jgi:hypothetical protein
MAETVGPQMDEEEFDSQWAEFDAEDAIGGSDIVVPKMGEDMPDAPQSEARPAFDIPDAGSGQLTQEEEATRELMAFMNS